MMNLVNSRRNLAESLESLQLEDAEVGHADALHLPCGLQSLHTLETDLQLLFSIYDGLNRGNMFSCFTF